MMLKWAERFNNYGLRVVLHLTFTKIKFCNDMQCT